MFNLWPIKLRAAAMLFLALTSGVLAACGSEGQRVAEFAAATATPALSRTAPTTATAQTSNSKSTISLATFSPTAQTTQAPLSATPAVTNDWQYRWLKGVPCQLPCWEGITPGVTKLDQALQILQKNPLVTGLKEIPPMGSKNTNRVIEWRLSGAGQKGFLGLIGYNITDPNKIIDGITPDYPHSFSIKEIIAALGEPSHALANADGCSDECPIYSLSLVYLDKGLRLYITIAQNGKQVKPGLLTDQLTTYSINIVVPGIKSFEENYTENYGQYKVPYNEAKLLVPWQGFQTFDYYCRNLSYIGEVESCKK